MGLEAVKEEVIRTAKEQERVLLAEARKESNKITKEAERKIEEIKDKSEAEIKKMIDTTKKQELASAELENKKILLEAKKQIIDDVFIGAIRKLENLDDKKRETYMEKLLEKTKNDIQVEYVYSNKKDSRFLKGFSAGTINVMGGLIAENKEKTVRVNYTFEAMLQNIKESELQNISKILFG